MIEEFKSPFRIIGGEKGSHCLFPVQIDMAGKGCPGGCAYCYGRALLEFRGNWNGADPAVTNVKKVEKLFESAFVKEKDSKDAKALREAKAIRIGGMTDPLLFNKEGTFKLMDLCDEYNKKYLLFTKGIVNEEVIEHVNSELAYFQMSIGTLNEEWIARCEPGASSASNRLDSIDTLVDNQTRVAARMGPIIPTSELFNYNMVTQICERNPDALIGEMVRFSGLIAKQLDEIDFNIREVHKEHQKFSNGTTFYTEEFRDKYYAEMQRICRMYNVDFTVCELDGFEYFKKYWTGKNDCCGSVW